MNIPVKITAVCGSLRNVSCTRFALKTVLQGASNLGADVKLIDLKDYKLVFPHSVEEKDYPEDVFKLRHEIHNADGIILGTPEYHGCLSGVLKTALDLMSNNEFDGKMVGLVGVAGGQLGAVDSLNSLRAICRSLHAWALPDQVSISESYKVFDENGNIRNQNIENRLLGIGRQLVEIISKNKNLYSLQLNHIPEKIAV